MAARDIMPWNSPMGGHCRIIWAGMTASETFREGEPVKLAAAGTVTESDDDPTGGQVVGIALSPVGYSIGGTATTKDPMTGAAYTTGSMISIAVGDDQTLFLTANFTTDGAAAGTPLVSHIGDEGGLDLISNVWYASIHSTNNTIKIVDVLDTNYRSISVTSGTGVYVVFKFSDSQWQNVTAPA